MFGEQNNANKRQYKKMKPKDLKDRRSDKPRKFIPGLAQATVPVTNRFTGDRKNMGIEKNTNWLLTNCKKYMKLSN